ncbi:cysteine--tRNA ligase [Candidatus Micrarchaeota archaeon CG10_big_fil_rev_8_21_14_0_10_45_29]|nr:MAG: cysteine--tRNA ligase [Candidatus Micrarchaeota archaeon CG10_big_fil_rev_8_21_14_0_10_45_29]
MLRLYNTLSRKVEDVKKRKGKPLFVYVCGITPYDNCHLGHARTFIAFDIMRRWMLHSGYNVKYIQNVTDIDDKIIKRAKERKMQPLELSSKYDKKAREEMKALNILEADEMPKISQSIEQTLALIQKLVDKKIAYITATGVYYDISKFPGYGKLSGQDLQKIKVGARIEVDEQKRNPEDFALWKLEESPGATYESPWGRGRPGWHIECSAMSMHSTGGEPLDLHCGARDLIFPHHENEIAQSEGAGYKPFSRMWAHTGFLTVNKEKMAKSLGNFVTIAEALKKWDANVLRLFFSLAHYRSPIDFSENAIEGAKNALENVRRSLSVMEGEGAAPDEMEEGDLNGATTAAIKSFSEHMDNDLNTPLALAELIEISKRIARVRAMGKCSRACLEKNAKKVAEAFAILGIEVMPAEAAGKASGIDEAEISRLIGEREEARKKKDFAKSDAIRDELAKAGVILEDGKDGVKWRYA